MKSGRNPGTLAFILCFGQALIPAMSAQAPAKAATSDPIVSISSGQLRGSLTAHGVAVFKNIPFAQPPVGELRWRDPRPPKAWTGVRDATAFGPMCNQNDNKQLPHSEDCLQLNVWTPTWPLRSSFPVMVWIHGGGNIAGSGVEALFNGEVLARHGVVVVNVNYRLGIFGFFAHPGLTKESPRHAAGNYGLADQIMALHWVRDNIARFGGNPANVTIFGESAGASDVDALIASPLSKGLFLRAMAQSGPVGAEPSLAESEKRGVDLAAKLGFTGEDSLARLRAVPDTKLMAKVAQAGPGLGINVDGWVLTEPAAKVYAQGREQKVALLIGNDSQEMQPRGASRDIRELIPERYGPLADRALAAYGVNGVNEPQPDPENGTVMLQFTTDNSFRCGTVQELIWHTAAGNPGYEYQFSRTVHGKEALGAPHASEIPFIFGTLSVWQNMRKYNDSDQQYAPLMQEYWTNFAKTGDPNGPNLVKWPRFDATARAYMDFTDAGPAAKEGLRRQVCDLFMENQKRQEQ
ncbi:MAG TPA: carboxylesterase family protein [Bryobacteraceae bacterium]|nr:carboxylesterase family protein [Bryobacteraceae bacterium]